MVGRLETATAVYLLVDWRGGIPRFRPQTGISCQVGSSWQRVAPLSNVIIIKLMFWTIIIMMMTPRDDPVADLAESVGNALLVFAERLRAAPEPTAAPDPTVGASHNSAPEPDRSRLGRTQAHVLSVVEGAGSDGLTAAEVSDKAGTAATNTPRILRALEERRLVTASDTRPTVWRVRAEEF